MKKAAFVDEGSFLLPKSMYILLRSDFFAYRKCHNSMEVKAISKSVVERFLSALWELWCGLWWTGRSEEWWWDLTRQVEVSEFVVDGYLLENTMNPSCHPPRHH